MEAQPYWKNAFLRLMQIHATVEIRWRAINECLPTPKQKTRIMFDFWRLAVKYMECIKYVESWDVRRNMKAILGHTSGLDETKADEEAYHHLCDTPPEDTIMLVRKSKFAD